jgi:aspartyl-tRNA(Asn)/glutamyl-tRNA(Gln) amidotransferase subunit A
MAKLDTNLFFMPARKLAERIQAGKLTSVDLTAGYLDRLERFGPRLNAVVTVMREAAMAEARAADKEIKAGKSRGPLHGIPYGVKDLLATKGVPTTWGATPYRHQIFEENATVIDRLRDKGAILIAKLAMVELAGGMGYNHADASFTGPGLTPWNTKFWSGGSSSGPGAAVAAGLVNFAIGSETSGSILTPAAFCGVTGLRPTYGLVSRHGAMALCWTLDKLGPMARSADDCALVIAAIAGKDDKDPSSVDRRFDYFDRGSVRKRLKIGIPKGVTEKVQPAVRENFDKAIDAVREIADVTTGIEWPDLPWGPAVGAIVGAEGASAFLDLIESGKTAELKCPKCRYAAYSGTLIPAVDYLQAMRLRGPMKRAVAAVFQQYDVIAAPTRASVSYPADKNFEDVYPGISGGPPLIAAGNLCGLPALALPNGYGENGLPTSISFLGPAFSEYDLVALGNAYQERTGWNLRVPPGVA